MNTAPSTIPATRRRRRRRIVAGAVGAGLAIAIGVAGTASAAPVTFDVSDDSAHCATADAKVTFGTPLKSSGTTSTSLTLKGHAASCLDMSNSLVGMFKGTASGSGTASTNACADWFGSGLLDVSLTGSARMTWTPAAGQKFTPTVAVGSAQKPVTDFTLDDFLTRPTNPVTETPDTYYFGVIAGAPSVDFVSAVPAGFGEYVHEDAGLLFAQCAGTGVKTLNLQVGYFVSGA